MLRSTFRSQVLEPSFVLLQIVAIQSAYYTTLSLLHIITLPLTKELQLRDLLSHDISILSSLLLLTNALLTCLTLVIFVQRSKQCIDFTLTLHGIHSLLVALYSGMSVLYIMLMITSCVITAWSSQFVCMKIELLPISITDGNKRRASVIDQELEELGV
jgi:hypothetical protein